MPAARRIRFSVLGPPPVAVVPVAAALIVDPVGSGVAVVAGMAVALPEPTGVAVAVAVDEGEAEGDGELVVLCVAGVAVVAGAVGLPMLGDPGVGEVAGAAVVLRAVISNDDTTSSCPEFRVHGTSILPG
jgi:hypothetical protein